MFKGGRELVVAGVVLASLSGAPAAFGHGVDGSLGVQGMSESDLREMETAMLGPEHAAEHAQQRAIEEEAEVAPASRAEPMPMDAPAGDPSQVGRWNAPFSVPITATHSVMLPTGKVMWWSYPNGAKASNTAQAWLWNPTTGTSNRVDPPLWTDPADGQEKPANIWCSGQVLLADGRVLVIGGNLAYTGGTPNFRGLNKVYTFNPFNETWTEQPDMPHGRWYPSGKLLPDGRVLIMGGFDESGQRDPTTNRYLQDRDIEVFTPSADMNGVGTLATIGSRGGTGEPPEGELYPRMFVMPSGRTLVAGPDPNDTWFFNDPIGASSFTWGDIPSFPNGESRVWSTTVPRPGAPTKVTVIGGKNWTSGPTLSTSLTFDEANAGPGWQSAPPLNVSRAHHNTVLLPDGSMATFGGGPGTGPQGNWTAGPEHHQVELFDPVANTWRLGPAQVENRAYHSTATLLPDGRVISAGSEDYFSTAGRDTAEIYEPPYLFKGPRPEINSAPDSINWGDEFGIKSWGSQISRATLVAPAAETHGNDMNQRYVELAITENLTGSGVNVLAPPDSKMAQPGYYMLFLLNQDGVPSVARWIRLDAAAPDRAKVLADVAPTAVADSATVAEDPGATAIDVLANDTNADGGPKSVAAASDPAHGTVVITGGGSGLTYQPDANYCNGGSPTDNFTYTLNGGSQATVSVTVSCVEDNPTAVNDSGTGAEDAGATAISVLANDTDPDGGTKQIASASDPANGAVVVAGNNLSLTYQPDPNYCNDGAPPDDTFTYTLNGGSQATVSVAVTCVDDSPTAVNDSASKTEDSGATAITVLSNDTDIDGGPKTISSASDPANGTVVLTGGTSGAHTGLTYQPDPNYCNDGAPPDDAFTYTVNGGSQATVSVAVTCVDDSPTAAADSATVAEDSGGTAIDVLANDGDGDGGAKLINSASDPPHGSVAIGGGGSSLTYRPDANYCGADSFTYSLNGGSSATVSISVGCVDDSPVALNDSATVAQNAGATTINVLANDLDPDGGSKLIVAASDAPHGTVAVATGGLSLTYRPDRDYCGADSFTYTLNGGSTATVAITVKRGKRKCRTAAGAKTRKTKRATRSARAAESTRWIRVFLPGW